MVLGTEQRKQIKRRKCTSPVLCVAFFSFRVVLLLLLLPLVVLFSCCSPLLLLLLCVPSTPLHLITPSRGQKKASCCPGPLSPRPYFCFSAAILTVAPRFCFFLLTWSLYTLIHTEPTTGGGGGW